MFAFYNFGVLTVCRFEFDQKMEAAAAEVGQQSVSAQVVRIVVHSFEIFVFLSLVSYWVFSHHGWVSVVFVVILVALLMYYLLFTMFR